MSKCINCAANAAYAVENPASPGQLFCEKHLPWFINKRFLPNNVKQLINSPIVHVHVADPVEEAPKPKAVKKKKVVEPVVEEPVVEEAVVETPAEESVED